jgi:hypothetical protein
MRNLALWPYSQGPNIRIAALVVFGLTYWEDVGRLSKRLSEPPLEQRRIQFLSLDDPF